MDLNNHQTRPAQPTLIDLMIVTVICSAITIFVFWIATRFMRVNLFEQLPEWIIGTYGYFTALGTGSVGFGAAIIKSLGRRSPGPDYVKLVAVFEGGIILLIVGIILMNRFVLPEPVPASPPKSKQSFKICFGEGGGQNCLNGADVRYGCNVYHSWSNQKWDELAANLCGYTLTKELNYSKVNIQNNGGGGCGWTAYTVTCP